MKLTKALAVIGLAMSLAGLAHAQTMTVSFSDSNSPPVLGSGLEVGTVQITNLVGATAYQKDNVDSADAHTYIEPDTVQGQIFTTGSDPSGYKLIQVSYRTPTYASGFSSMGGFTYNLRVIKPPSTAANATSNNNTNILATKTAEVGYGPNSPGAINILDGSGGRVTQNGTWITYTFDNPVFLQPNTAYGFDVMGVSFQHYYYEVDGNSNALANSVAYYCGTNGAIEGLAVPNNTINNLVGSRIFVASMFPGSVGIAPAMITQPVSGGVYRGGTAILSPRVRGDTNSPVFKWYKNGVALSDGGKVSGSSTASLTITNVGSSDAASYTLAVTNAYGSVTSSVATLSVVHPPTAGYAYVIYTNKPITYWRLNENVNPATNAATYDYITGGAGFWGQNALETNGPASPAFPGFESTNTATSGRANYTASTGTNQSWSTFTSMRTNTGTVTITGWIYPIGTVPAKYTGLIFVGGGQAACGLVVSDSGSTVSYDWADRKIRGNTLSGLGITANEWQFIALVVTPGQSAVCYRGNSAKTLSSATDTISRGFSTIVPEPLDAHWFAGYDPRYAGEWAAPGPGGPQYVLNGAVDEVAVFPAALTSAQITTIYNAAFTNIVGSPVADFTSDVTNAFAAQTTVHFTNLSDGTITNYLWNFGDSTTSTATNPAHVYSTAGTYGVSLTVIGPGGSNSLTNAAYITVNPGAISTTNTLTRTVGASPATYGDTLTFRATITPTNGIDGLPVMFMTNGVAFATNNTAAGVATVTPAANVLQYSGGSAYTVTANFPGNLTYINSSGTLSGGQQINQKTLTVSGLAANNKSYDGTLAATINTNSEVLSGVVSGDSGLVDVDTSGATFASKTVSNGIVVSLSGLLTGSHAGNYSFTAPSLSANITARLVTFTAVANIKDYDGTTSAAAIPAVTAGSVAPGQTATIVETYDTPAAGSGKTLTPSAPIIKDSGNVVVTTNYTVTLVATNTGVINPCTSPIAGGVSPTNQTVGLGAPFVFALTNVTGSTPFYYHWLSNNVMIAGATYSSYTNISASLAANGASYACQVSNICGASTSSVATLEVVPLATVTLSNLNQAFAGTPRVVTATATPAVSNIIVTYYGSNYNFQPYPPGYPASGPTNVAPSDPGAYIVVGTVDDPSYRGSATNTLIVTPLTINVTADAGSKTFGDPDPAVFTYHYTPALVANPTGDTNVDWFYTFFGELERQPGEDAGVYTIGQASLGLYAIYNLVYTSNIFTINPISTTNAFARTSGSSSQAYGNSLIFTATVSNITTNTNNTAVAATGNVVLYDSSTPILTNSPASSGTNLPSSCTATFDVSTVLQSGAHSLKAVFVGDLDHSSSTSSVVSQTITARVVTLSGGRTYDGTANITAAQLTVANNVDGANLTLSGNAVLSAKDVGSQTISWGTTGATRVQSVAGGNAGATTVALTLGSAPVNGNVLVAVISTRGTAINQVSSISGGGVTWSRASQSVGTAGSTTEIWYGPNVTSGTTAITINLAASLSASAVVAEYSGVLTASPLDQVANNSGNGASADTGTSPTTTSPSELWIGGVGLANNGYTLGMPNNSFTSFANAASSSGNPSSNSVVYALENIVTATGTANSGGAVSGIASIALRGTSATSNSTTTTLTLSKPSGVVQGDVMIANIASSGGASLADPVLSGWTLITPGVQIGTSGSTRWRGAVLYRVAGASEGATYAFSITGNSSALGAIVAFSGVDATTPIDANGTIQANASSTTATAAGITTVSANAAVIMFGQAGNASPTWSTFTTTSPGALSVLYGGTAANPAIGAAWGTKSTAGATGNGTAALSVAALNGGVLVALKPASQQWSGAIATFKASPVLTLGGSAAANYTLVGASGSATITAKPLTFTGITANNKAYNGTTVATLSGTPALLGSEPAGTGTTTDGKYYTIDGTVTTGPNSMKGTFASANVGTGIAVTPNSDAFTLTNANYSIGSVSPAMTANITATNLSITAGDIKTYGQIKTYGAGSTAFMSTGLQNGETIGSVTITVNGSPNGTNATDPVSTYTNALTPSAATNGTFTPANYTISYNSGNLVVTSLAVALTGSRNYDGTTNATYSILTITNIVGSDDVTLTNGTCGLAGKNAGTNAITSSGTLALGGARATNYTVTGVTGSVTINPLPVILTGIRAYNGGYNAGVVTANLSISNKITGDNLTISGTGVNALTNKNVGVEPIITFGSYTLGGTATNNYTLNGASGTVTVTNLPAIFSGTSRAYDGTANAPATILSVQNKVSGDDLTLSGTGTLASQYVGTRALTSFGTLTLGGGDAINYILLTPSGSVVINKLAANLSGSRAYDATTNAAAAILSVANKVGNDDVSMASGTGGLAGPNTGTQALTSFGSLALGGTLATNYTLTGASGSVIITQAVTSISLSSSKNPSGYKDSVTFTATALPSHAAGNVTFKTNSLALSTNALSSGVATSDATAALPRGTNTIVVEYPGDLNHIGSTNSLSVGQIVTNHPPTTALMTVQRIAGMSLQIAFTDLATNWSDVDGDALTAAVNLVSTNNVTLSTNASFITYPSSAPNVNDQLNYSINDGWGGLAAGVVRVTVVNPAGKAQSISVSNHTVTVNFSGVPGFNYSLQRSTNLIHWDTVLTTNAPGGAVFQFVDDFGGGPAPSSAYYRTLWNP